MDAHKTVGTTIPRILRNDFYFILLVIFRSIFHLYFTQFRAMYIHTPWGTRVKVEIKLHTILDLNYVFYFHTWSLSLSWWPMIADAWWGYFCFRCSRNASLFLSISEGCIPKISWELRGPPTVCLRRIWRPTLEWVDCLFAEVMNSLGHRQSVSSNEAPCPFLFPRSVNKKETNQEIVNAKS